MFGFKLIKISELNSLNKKLSEATREASLKQVQIDILRVSNSELYNKIHKKPHNSKGHFCKKEEAVNGANN